MLYVENNNEFPSKFYTVFPIPQKKDLKKYKNDLNKERVPFLISFIQDSI